MAWLEITVNTAPDTLQSTVNTLTAAGFSDLLIEDEAEFSDFLEQNRAYWDYIDETLQQKLQGVSRVKLYLEETDTALSQLQSLLDSLNLPMSVATLPDTDWEESWKDNYPPQEVGEKLVVLPAWLADTNTHGRLPVILDPGLTFGTGAHPSTQMVMEVMEQQVKPGFRCLDLGSGSGILSITALQLGADYAIGVDIDPKAEDIARENAALNCFYAPTFTAMTGNVLSDKLLMEKLSENHWDLVFVNIVADVIIALAPILPTFLDMTSILICSGILDNRLSDVTTALERAGLTVTKVLNKEEWRCVCVRR